ncbi:hypothetical protein GCM10011583_64620 [Streptomyces camponoticapitis]|uniref:SpdD protein n=1 Tax=Streptomyces camponoticapitis TaxID=1616125 RepID=A0ABQ2ESN3_9ACTN|nr:hypothetical protein [Streptomyces camponoticapitis]GGK23764.1 hypothetical protein GCM10011583_64620 [Streptomyces camponoticapitis]
MNDREPPGTLAPHIPADLYRQAQTTGRPIVIVHTTPQTGRPARAYLIPIVITGACALGLIGTIAAVLALIEYAAHTAAAVASAAGPIGVGGLTLKLARSKGK